MTLSPSIALPRRWVPPVLTALLLLPAAARGQNAAALEVRVADLQGQPLRGALVSLPGTQRGGYTNERGWVRLVPLPAGAHFVEIRSLGYRTERFRVELQGGMIDQWEVVLEREPIPLAAVEVVAEEPDRRMDFLRGFHERRDRGVGYFLTREEIEEQGSTDLGNLLRMVPGLRVPPTQFGQSRIATDRRQTLGRCSLRVYVDGVKYRSPDDLVGIPVLDVEAIEVYRGRSELPAEFADMDANCGVIVLWSRRHRPEG